MRDQVLDHWNRQASRGEAAGTQDLLAQQLEHRSILVALGRLRPSTILEVGCGTGVLARLMAEEHPAADILALDFSEQMIAAAKARPYPASRLRFAVGDVQSLPHGRWDVVVTERMLINLQTWPSQQLAIEAIQARLQPGGSYLMCENSADGLEAINASRVAIGLPAITAPWHNRYLRTQELEAVAREHWAGLKCEEFSSTYYFLSRVVNAWQAQQAGEAPRYDAAINQLALVMEIGGPWAQGRLWTWENWS